MFSLFVRFNLSPGPSPQKGGEKILLVCIKLHPIVLFLLTPLLWRGAGGEVVLYTKKQEKKV